MKRGTLKIISKLALMLVLCLGLSIFFSSCSLNLTKEKPTYSVTGFILDDFGQAVEGATLESSLGLVTTDQNGKYTISGISDNLIIKASAEGYLFERNSIQVSGANDNANFTAYKCYNLSGTVKNGTALVSDANIVVDSLAGAFHTVSDELGNFAVTGVAGQAKIQCEVEGEDGSNFFELTASREDHENLQINTTTLLTLKFNFDTNNVDFSKIELYIDNRRIESGLNLVTEIGNVHCGSQVELRSDYYKFNKSKFSVLQANQITKIDLYEIYGVEGYVRSGQTALQNAKVYINGAYSTTSDSSGRFYLSGLVRQNEITVEYKNFAFSAKTVNNGEQAVIFNGTKSIAISFNFDYMTEQDIEFVGGVGALTGKTAGTKVYEISGLSLGDRLSFMLSGYRFEQSGNSIEQNSIIVEGASSYSFDLQKIYSVDLSGIDEFLNQEGFCLLLDGADAEPEAFISLFGEHTVSARYLNYVFEQVGVNAANHSAGLSYKIPYDVKIKVHSGETGKVTLMHASARLKSGECVTADANGTINLQDIVGEQSVEISHDGYNNRTVVINENSGELDVNLSYTLTGKVFSGMVNVQGVDIRLNFNGSEQSVKTDADGEFFFNEVCGEAELQLAKSGYKFRQFGADSAFASDCNISVSGGAELEVQATYSISGTLTENEQPLVSAYVIMMCQDSLNGEGPVREAVTDSQGKYYFNDIYGACQITTLAADRHSQTYLNPSSYKISASGVFDFDNKGYSVSGRVCTGGLGVEGAYVSAGNVGVSTDSEGYYKFEMLTGENEIFVTLEGYRFTVSGTGEESKKVSSSGGEVQTDIDFDATFTVSGDIYSGEKLIAGVRVDAGEGIETNSDQSGHFEISGLSGNVNLTFSLSGYTFGAALSMSGAGSVRIDCKKHIAVTVKSGDLDVENFEVYVDGQRLKVAEGKQAEIDVEVGKTVELKKEGYQIESFTAGEADSVASSATYSISGRVVSGSVAIDGATVNCGEQSTTTDEAGNFTLNKLSGRLTLTVIKSKFNFNGKEVCGHETELLLNMTYSISGTVAVLGKPLLDVEIQVEGTQIKTSTGNGGSFTLSGISGEFSLLLQKEGYSFDSISNKFGEQNLNISAKFTLKGRVVFAEKAISGALVSVSMSGTSKLLTTSTGADGSFEIEGIYAEAVLSISKHDYNMVELSSYCDYTANIEVKLTFNLKLRFDITGVTVYVDDKPLSGSGTLGKELTLEKRDKPFTLRFEKKSAGVTTSFTPNNISVDEAVSGGVIQISSKETYNISGKVTTASGLAVKGVTVTSTSGAGKSVSCETGEDGSYSFNEVIGSVRISQKSIEPETKYFNSSGTINFTISEKDFAFMLYDLAYDILSEPDTSYFMKGTGDVTPDQFAGPQKVYSSARKDVNGNIIKQNLNYGDTVAGVDPKVSLITYYDKSANQWYIDQIKNVSSDLTAPHTVSALLGHGVSPDDYKNTYGSYPDAYLPYNFSKNNNVKSVSAVKLNGNDYEFTIELSAGSATYSNYLKQMTALSGQTPSSFNYIKLTYTVGKDGVIKKLTIDEQYVLKIVVTITITSVVNYDFTVARASEGKKLEDINISTDEYLRAAVRGAGMTTISLTQPLAILPNNEFNKRYYL